MGARIDSSFALLDVKRGRGRLAERVGRGERVPVVIRGYLEPDHRAVGNDDGVSREFGVVVESAEEVE